MSPLLPLAVAFLYAGESPAPAQSVAQTSVALRVTSVDDGEAKLLEQQLMRQLGDRLLEDGYRVVPSSAVASVRVWIHLGADEAIVDTRGAGHRVERIADGDPEVMTLELQQLTTALVDELRPAQVESRPAIVVEIGGESSDPQLRERLQIGLLGRGFALTRQPGAEDARLCVTAGAAGFEVHVVPGLASCATDSGSTGAVSTGAVSTGVASTGVASTGVAGALELERELVLDEASSSLARWLARTSPTLGDPPELQPRPITEAELPPTDATIDRRPPTPAPEPRPLGVAVAASGGVLGRAGGADPTVNAELRAGRRRGIGGGAALLIAPSRVADLRVLEYVPSATFDWRLGFGERGLASLGVWAGAHVHSYSHASQTTARGTRVGPSVGASVRLSFLADRGFMVFGGVRGGWSGGRWIHVANGQAHWRRSTVMVGLELGVGWDLRLRGRR